MDPATGRLPGALVISLDFELHWGVRDRDGPRGTYSTRLYGAREVVPRLLRLFQQFEVAATWATVGFLFARTRDELERFAPTIRPVYENSALQPFGEPVGDDEEADPLHYAASLIEHIAETSRQEVATHTFSHYYCGEAGQDVECFAADLEAARAIARERGVELRSIVFPRNQHNAEYDPILLANGIIAYRGNPRSRMWRVANSEEGGHKAKRAARLLDAYMNLDGHHSVSWENVLKPSGLADVRASRFLRPYVPELRAFEPLRLRRIRKSIRRAARSGHIYHLWWHPHNFGTHVEDNLAFLCAVLTEFADCRDRYGMLSLTMADVAGRVDELGNQRPAFSASAPTGGPAR